MKIQILRMRQIYSAAKCTIAAVSLGYIALDREWRAGQGEECIMEFMALAGKKHGKWEGEWVITMLMCLQRMEKLGIRDHERLQVMDCDFHETWWLSIVSDWKGNGVSFHHPFLFRQNCTGRSLDGE
ncbi:hypothetical protein DPSP01_002611 [Paraphaeosphaeria sporulosa]